ncbi:nucleotidyltransferase [bacterium LRH843]|nr:nucleotidyltransferase [bacterium LRH843]
MKAVGIVVEYNPFHNGHLYHARQARTQTDSDIVMAVMSASFLQRGEPALVSKWARTKMALSAGIDIVIELPYLYSTQKAELFASGAVSILAEMGADAINFGSESGDIDAFWELVSIMEERKLDYSTLIKELMKQGFSYPKATAEAFKKLNLGEAVLALDEPNNILGYHYVKAIRDRYDQMKATTTLRRQAHYHDSDVPETSIASATSIRKALSHANGFQEVKHVMPASTYHFLHEYVKEHSFLHTWENYFPFLYYKVISSSPEELRAIYECEEGLEYRAIEMMKISTTFRGWMENMKTKRYTWTRLQRLATHILTNTTKEEMALGLAYDSPSYIRLLGMNERGQKFLNQTKKKRDIPLLTKLTKATEVTARIEERATNIYYSPLSSTKRTQQMKKEARQIPIRISDLPWQLPPL